MECPVCRTDNTSGVKYCIKCGRNLENFPEVNYGQADRGGYHTEEEYSAENKGFEMSDGVFTVNDRQSPYIYQDLFTSEELNNTVEEYDFGGQSESTVEEYDFGGQTESPVEEYDFGGQIETSQDNSASVSEEPLNSQPYAEYANNSVPLPAPPYQDMYGNPPPVIGYDQNRMPVYGQSQFAGYNQSGIPVYTQPSVYSQPQFMGYDQNGMPVYSQQSSYSQPQFMGYDQNGMPIYSQPSVYSQPQFMGYDQNGMPVYSQPSGYPSVQTAPPNIPESVSAESPQTDETAEKFMDFLDDGESEKSQSAEEDFFGKSSDMGSVDVPIPDVGSLKKRETKKKVYMTDVEVVDAKNLVPNNASKFNQKYMKQAQQTGSGDLGEKNHFGRKVSMRGTKNVDAEMLNPKFEYKSRIRMGDASNAQVDNFNTRTVRQRKFTMAEADHAVEAMPKKKKYVDELDLIELPEYMQARKKSKKDDTDFPSMTDL